MHCDLLVRVSDLGVSKHCLIGPCSLRECHSGKDRKRVSPCWVS